MTSRESVRNALSALQSAAEKIRLVEIEAREALFEKDDPAAYRQKLREKATILLELSETVAPFYEGMDKDARAECEKGLSSFAMRAAQALELSSIFYMSALLYPEDYREGDPNDLESFIDRLRQKHLP
jgi:hypothetical protein